MNAQEKMAQIINYVSEKFPDIILDKKWNRLLRDMSKELEILEKSAQQSVQADGARFCPACHALLEEHSVYCDTCGTDTPRR